MIGPRLAAQACQMAYDRTDIEVGEAKALLINHVGHDELTVAFQGTHDIGQALEDLDCRPRFVAGIGYCHHGFAVLAEAVYPRIHDLAKASGVISLTGHSLGGAIALLVGAMLVRDQFWPDEVITFGAPRVSVGPAVGRLFKRTGLSPSLYRFGVDIVPTLPPIFAHPAPLIQIGTPSDGMDAGERDHGVENYVTALANLPEGG